MVEGDKVKNDKKQKSIELFIIYIFPERAMKIMEIFNI